MSDKDSWTNPVLAEIEEKQDELFALIRNAKRDGLRHWDDQDYKNFHQQLRHTAHWLLFESNELLETFPIHGMLKAKVAPVEKEDKR